MAGGTALGGDPARSEGQLGTLLAGHLRRALREHRGPAPGPSPRQRKTRELRAATRTKAAGPEARPVGSTRGRPPRPAPGPGLTCSCPEAGRTCRPQCPPGLPTSRVKLTPPQSLAHRGQTDTCPGVLRGSGGRGALREIRGFERPYAQASGPSRPPASLSLFPSLRQEHDGDLRATRDPNPARRRRWSGAWRAAHVLSTRPGSREPAELVAVTVLKCPSFEGHEK